MTTTTDTKSLADLKSTADRRRLAQFVAQYRENKDTIVAMESANESLMEKHIAPLLDKLKLRRLDAPEEGWMCLKQKWSNSTIHKKLLLARGVDPDDIAAATVKKSGSKWQIRGKNEKQENGDGNEEE